MATKNSPLHDRDGFVQTETVAYQLGGINNQITDDFGADNDLEVKGGGRGWTATTTRKGRVLTAKGTSKVAAAEALYEEAKRVATLELDLTDEDMTEAEFENCVSECVGSPRLFCECKCGGRNHGLMGGVKREEIVLLGEKQCACGCGQTTNRTYVPGHDARHHGLLKLREWATANGQTGTDEELRKAKAAAMRKAARERRAALRAEVKAKAEAVAKAVAPKPAKQTRKGNPDGLDSLRELLPLR